MTPTEKDAMALAVLDRIGTAPISETERGQVAAARAHLAARLGELEAGWASEKEAYDGLADKYEEMERRATCAEAELAAVLDAASFFARSFSGKNSDKLRKAIAAVDAARGGPHAD